MTLSLSLVAAAVPGEPHAGLARAGCRTRRAAATSPPSPAPHRRPAEGTGHSPRFQGAFREKSRVRGSRCLCSPNKPRAHRRLHKTQAPRLNSTIRQRPSALRCKTALPGNLSCGGVTGGAPGLRQLTSPCWTDAAAPRGAAAERQQLPQEQRGRCPGSRGLKQEAVS